METPLIIVNKYIHSFHVSVEKRQIAIQFNPEKMQPPSMEGRRTQSERMEDLMTLYKASGFKWERHPGNVYSEGTLTFPEDVPFEKTFAMLLSNMEAAYVLDNRTVKHIRSKSKMKTDTELGVDHGKRAI